MVRLLFLPLLALYWRFIVLDAWSKSPERFAAQRAEDILRQMHYLSEFKKMDLHPDVFCFTIVISCWARSGLGREGAERAEKILNYMEHQHLEDNKNPRPNVRTFNAVIDAWYKSGSAEAPLRCDTLLNRMLKLYEDGDKGVAPESFTFNTIMNIWVRNGVGDVGSRIKEIFDQMVTMYQNGNRDCAPDAHSYAALLYYHSNSNHPEADVNCDEILSGMISSFKSGKSGAAPSLKCFKMVIETWSKSQRPGAANRAGATLQLVLQLYEDGWIDAFPTPFCFRAVIASYAYNNDDPESVVKATTVLRQMYQAFQAGLIDCKPTAHEYIIVLNAWAKSKFPKKAVHAEQMLRDLLKECRPGNEYAQALVNAYTTVINACAFASGDAAEQREAFSIAKLCLHEVYNSPYGKPNCITFGTFLKACSRLDITAADRNLNIRAAFRMACDCNEAGDFVLSQLRYAASSNLYAELMREAPEQRRKGAVSHTTHSAEIIEFNATTRR